MSVAKGRRVLRLVMALTVIVLLASISMIGAAGAHELSPASWLPVNVLVHDGWPSSGSPSH